MLGKIIKSLIGGNKIDNNARPPVSAHLPDDKGARSTPSPAVSNNAIDTAHIPSGDVITAILPVETSGTPNDSETLGQRFLGRQPLLDRAQHVVGYELMLRRSPLKGDGDLSELRLVHSQTLVRCLLDLDIGRLVGGKQALIELSPEMLDNPLLNELPQKGITLCIDFKARMDAETVSRCRSLKGMGYQFALDNLEPMPGVEPLIELAQFVRIDVTRYNAIELARLVDKLLGKSPQLQLIARNVHSETEFEACHRLFFHFFQGYYFAKLQPAAPSRIDSDRVRVMELLNMVKNRAEVPALEEIFKHDAMLSYKLLLYMNAPINGLAQQIRSIAHAIMILGYEQLYRWLTLLLFTSGSLGPRSKALLKSALIRARMMELLGSDRMKGQERDGLFIVGVFSLLDVLLNVPMVQAVERLHLPEAIVDGLVRHTGIYAPYLNLVLACEEADEDNISRMAGACGLDAGAVNQAHIQSLIWAEGIDL